MSSLFVPFNWWYTRSMMHPPVFNTVQGGLVSLFRPGLGLVLPTGVCPLSVCWVLFEGGAVR